MRARIVADPVLNPSPGPWLTIIGIGEDGLAGLSDASRKALANAETVFGGERHLALPCLARRARPPVGWRSVSRAASRAVGPPRRPSRRPICYTRLLLLLV